MSKLSNGRIQGWVTFTGLWGGYFISHTSHHHQILWQSGVEHASKIPLAHKWLPVNSHLTVKATEGERGLTQLQGEVEWFCSGTLGICGWADYFLMSKTEISENAQCYREKLLICSLTSKPSHLRKDSVIQEPEYTKTTWHFLQNIFTWLDFWI